MTPLARQLRSIASGSRPLQSRLAHPRHIASRLSRRAAPLPASPIDASALPARVEAVLFLAKEALSLRRIAQLAGLDDATQARTLLDQLSRQYARCGRAFQVEHVAGGYRLLTRPQFAPWIVKLGGLCDQEVPTLKLTPPALDTLTVVAYRQPVLRSEVEAVRGVGCGELLRQLIERDLLRIVGRSEELGRPLEYGTTKRFLQLFGLNSLKDLPSVDGLGEFSQQQLARSDSRQQNVVPRAA